jgi:hypothetical protein
MTSFVVQKACDMVKYMIRPDTDDWVIKTEGSYGVFAARVVGLSFAQYLQYIRDNYNGIIVGSQGYSSIQFKNKTDAERCAKFLNERLLIVKENV